MASHSRNKSTSTATSGPIPMPKSESFCDKIIGICAGRHARERVDRARWLRYFQSLPDTTHDEPAALAASFKQTTISSNYSSFSSVFTCPQSSSISIQSPATTINSGPGSPNPARCAYTANRRKVLDLEGATYQSMEYLYGPEPPGPVMYHEAPIFPNTMMQPTQPFVPASYAVEPEPTPPSPPCLPIPSDVMNRIAHTSVCNDHKPTGSHHVLTPLPSTSTPRPYSSFDFNPAPLPARGGQCRDYQNVTRWPKQYISNTIDLIEMRNVLERRGPVRILTNDQLFGKGRVAQLKAQARGQGNAHGNGSNNGNGARRQVPRPAVKPGAQRTVNAQAAALRRPRFAAMRRSSRYTESGTRIE